MFFPHEDSMLKVVLYIIEKCVEHKSRILASDSKIAASSKKDRSNS